jgi:hypothetical protein
MPDFVVPVRSICVAGHPVKRASEKKQDPDGNLGPAHFHSLPMRAGKESLECA